ncbi:transmembrane protein 187 [Notolabrus celidotus]|uniref:transmembrane protein 187 n=1 Tax=Notolabrus celidotus TaxID=1203425 RepID=UPI00148F8C34|nr:transmembrane protein 187 [Notolabrus celidotus]
MLSALLHVTLPLALCALLTRCRLFDAVAVDLSYDHYAEQRVDHLPPFLAMPCNCLVNLLYAVTGLYWLLRDSDIAEPEQGRYLRQVFAFMSIFYAPVQWARLAVLQRAPAVLDQWVTLPIFAWVLVWICFIERGPKGWRVWHAAALELLSVLSYGLALLHERGFEAALGGHVLVAVYKGVRVQLTHGDARTRRYLLLAVLSCCGFVGLKLLDLHLARFHLFQRLTGHFWSKVCDVMQIHFSICFLNELTTRTRKTRSQRD